MALISGEVLTFDSLMRLDMCSIYKKDQHLGKSLAALLDTQDRGLGLFHGTSKGLEMLWPKTLQWLFSTLQLQVLQVSCLILTKMDWTPKAISL